MDINNLYEKFQKLPKMLKFETVLSLLAQKADSDRFLKTLEMLTTYPGSQAINTSKIEDMSIEDFLGEIEIDSVNDDEMLSEQKESLKAVSFDFLILLQDFSYEMEDEDTEIDFELTNASDMTYVITKVTCKSDEHLEDIRENFLFKKGFIYKTVDITKKEGSIEAVFHIYGVGPDEICLN